MAPAPSLVGLFIAPLNRAGIEYMTTGGLAAVVYGHPRLTLDVDLVIRLAPREIATFARLWPSGQFYCPPEEVIAQERDRSEHGHFNVIHHDTAMRADVYLAGADALRRWALQHRVVRIIEGEAVQFAGLPRAGRSTGVVVDGAYVDSSVPAGFSYPADPIGSMTSRQGAFGRAGVYSLRVQSDGYQTWTLSGVRVKSDGCSVVPERVQAALQPVR